MADGLAGVPRRAWAGTDLMPTFAKGILAHPPLVHVASCFCACALRGVAFQDSALTARWP